MTFLKFLNKNVKDVQQQSNEMVEKILQVLIYYKITIKLHFHLFTKDPQTQKIKKIS
jgi:hypothetical protein